MAIYTGRLDLADAFAAPLVSDRPDGLWPTVVCDEHGTRPRPRLLLGRQPADGGRRAARRLLVALALRLWRKGETSGAVQELVRVEADCDRDALRFTVRQTGRFLPSRDPQLLGRRTPVSRDLERRLVELAAHAEPGSYTSRLAGDPGLLAAKLVEEAGELAEAGSDDEVVWEAADVLYFTLVKLAADGTRLEDVAQELDRRALRVRRRDGSRDRCSRRRPGHDAAPARASTEVQELRREAVDAATLRDAAVIVDDVRRGGEAALRRYAEKFGERTADATSSARSETARGRLAVLARGPARPPRTDRRAHRGLRSRAARCTERSDTPGRRRRAGTHASRPSTRPAATPRAAATLCRRRC